MRDVLGARDALEGQLAREHAHFLFVSGPPSGRDRTRCHAVDADVRRQGAGERAREPVDGRLGHRVGQRGPVPGFAHDAADTDVSPAMLPILMIAPF